MKYFLSLFIVASSLLNAVCQNSTTDSLIKLLNNASNDTNQVNRLIAIASSYYFYKPDTSIAYSKKALQLARDLDFKRGIFQSLSLAGESSRILGDYPGSMKMQLEALEVSRKTKNGNGEIASLCYIGVIYNELKEYRSALNFLFPANAISQNLPIGPLTVFILTSMGVSYHFLNMPDSALYFLRQASIKNHEVNHPQLNSLIPISIGNIFAGIGNNDSALYYYTKGLQNSLNSNESINLGRGNLKIAELYFAEGKYDSSLYFVRNSFRESKRTAQKVNILEASTLLVKLYRQFHEMDSAFYYEDIATAMKDSLYGPEKFKKLQLLMLDKQEKQQEADSEEEQYRNNIKYTLLFISLGVFLIISFILFRANRQKQKAKTKIENAYVNLKDTQALLIQREKMASLGELTAGIAHEIQNPLNFVNNFSEVNTELIDELQEEVGKGNYEDVKAIANDIKENSQKINHHGKRAGDIVKGMLQHSRLSSGQKEPTDINALCDEYLRLSY
ncbi:MAG: histidine kinase dimerization/phospho-acceptor domain-containing protein, partial [Bacteroidota bacterium]|nr:histidine kinase dimerization/phospho-acceptor domain-containing protein [Bacteroidota bacterium]